MTTTAAGDAAVARLNNATRAFEKIITGASNQVVDVPGYGNQPTLAGRVDQRLDETTAAAAAEADRSRDEADRATTQATAAANSVTLATAEYNKAKTQADRAQSEADRAAQITGLETVSDAIGMAALPLPDVWAPLSDSLRMITGYGRDVLVGSDVVARMVNFSRNTAAAYVGKDGQWKNAAANEPRFEREGLLIEGQSTNVFNKGSGTNFDWISGGLTQSAGDAQLPFTVFQKKITSSTSNPTHIGRVLADIYNTPNPAASGGGPVTASAIMFGDADAIIAADPKLNFASNLTITGVTNSTVKLTSGMVRVVWTGIITAGSAANFFNFQLSWLNRLPSVVAGCYQIEAIPFASSYIPTNGAAVTRAADVCWIPNALNVTPDYGDITIAMEVRRNLAIPSSVFPRAIHISDSQFVVADSVRIMARGGGAEQVNISAAAPGTMERIAATIKGSTIACFLNGTKATLPQTPILPVSNGTSCFIGSRNGLDGLFGHVRNVRIWQRNLSDEQIKAAA